MKTLTVSKLKRINPTFFDKSHTKHDVSYSIKGMRFTVVNLDPWGNKRAVTYDLLPDLKITAARIIKND